MIMPNKTVKIYPDNNSWVSKSLKKKNSQQKEDCFSPKDQIEWKRVQSKLRKEIREARKQYKEEKKKVSHWEYARCTEGS